MFKDDHIQFYGKGRAFGIDLVGTDGRVLIGAEFYQCLMGFVTELQTWVRYRLEEAKCFRRGEVLLCIQYADGGRIKVISPARAENLLIWFTQEGLGSLPGIKLFATLVERKSRKYETQHPGP